MYTELRKHLERTYTIKCIRQAVPLQAETNQLRQSTRRVVFSSTGWQRKGVPGCQPQQTMPRELRLSNASEAASGNGGA